MECLVEVWSLNLVKVLYGYHDLDRCNSRGYSGHNFLNFEIGNYYFESWIGDSNGINHFTGFDFKIDNCHFENWINDSNKTNHYTILD